MTEVPTKAGHCKESLGDVKCRKTHPVNLLASSCACNTTQCHLSNSGGTDAIPVGSERRAGLIRKR